MRVQAAYGTAYEEIPMLKIKKIFKLTTVITLLMTVSTAWAGAADPDTDRRVYLKQTFNQILSLTDAGKLQEAARVTEAALNNQQYRQQYRKDELLILYQLQGWVYFRQLRWPELIKCGQAIFKLDPENEWGPNYIALAYANLDKFSEALAFAQKAKPFAANKTAGKINATLQRELPAAINGKLTPAQLWQAFQTNELAANRKYQGKEIMLVGSVSKISEGILGTSQLEFAVGSHDHYSVVCIFPMSAIEELSQLQVGKATTVIGRVEGLSLGIAVRLRDCFISQIMQP
jgi:tetratricopeptide (TPR) repeat protein